MTRPILTASDALAALDAWAEVELRFDGPMPEAEKAEALATVEAGRAWIAAHPEETRVERERRRELLRGAADGDASWARATGNRREGHAAMMAGADIAFETTRRRGA